MPVLTWRPRWWRPEHIWWDTLEISLQRLNLSCTNWCVYNIKWSLFFTLCFRLLFWPNISTPRRSWWTLRIRRSRGLPGNPSMTIYIREWGYVIRKLIILFLKCILFQKDGSTVEELKLKIARSLTGGFKYSEVRQQAAENREWQNFVKLFKTVHI